MQVRLLVRQWLLPRGCLPCVLPFPLLPLLPLLWLALVHSQQQVD